MIPVEKWFKVIEKNLSGIERDICLASQIYNNGTHYTIRLAPSARLLLSQETANSIRAGLGFPKPIQFSQAKVNIDNLPIDYLKSKEYSERLEREQDFANDEGVKAALNEFDGATIEVE